MNKNLLKTRGQKQTILLFIEKDGFGVKYSVYLAKIFNKIQIFYELWQQVLKKIISKFFEIIDWNGNRCHSKRYYIPPEYKPIIQEFLKKGGLPATLKRTKHQKINSRYKNHNKEVV
jgi:hypothetical protein